jgi:isopentenyl-diphosphate delta-isomerase
LASRKHDHIELAFQSRVSAHQVDDRFYYEPLLSAHPTDTDLSVNFLGNKFNYPIWISSMTGGTERARMINENLARLCFEFGLGMGLGSCRALLDSNDRLADFNMRAMMGDRPLYANLGIAQVEQLIVENAVDKIAELLTKLHADGIFVHVNPLQEWAQPEGDQINRPPIETIAELCSLLNTPIAVKEVGQGMGPKSLFELMKLPLATIEFGASGGTNFTQLELNRLENKNIHKAKFSTIGHTAEQMVEFVNEYSNHKDVQCKDIIISGGVSDYLHGYYLMETCQLNSIYGQASAFLRHALVSYEDLVQFFQAEMEGLAMAKSYLHIRSQSET